MSIRLVFGTVRTQRLDEQRKSGMVVELRHRSYMVLHLVVGRGVRVLMS